MENKHRKSINRISLLLIALGIVVCLYPLFTSLNSYYEQKELEKELEEQIALIDPSPSDEATQEESPLVERQTDGTSSPGNDGTANQTEQPAQPAKPARQVKAMMRLEIPDIHLSTIVVSGTSQNALYDGPGWYEESAYPGKGNTAIAGHNNMYGSWFRNIKKLQPGNEIYISYKGKKYTYTVETVFPIATNDWSVIAPTKDSVLTLTTCHTKTERLACRAVLTATTEI